MMAVGPSPAPKEPTPDELLRPRGIVLLGAYLILLPAVLLWVLVAVFPQATPVATQTTPAAGQPPAAAGQPTVTQTTTRREPKFPRVPIITRPVLVELGPLSDDQGMILLAVLAGALGSYLHVAQSFASYVGNRTAKRSWVWWYLLRAPIGASLGVLFYFVVRAGLTSGVTDAVSTYGVVAFAALAGMFSKQATEKLNEIFDTLFRSQRPMELKDKLAQLTLTGVHPSSIQRGTGPVSLLLTGTGFSPGAEAKMGDVKLPTQFNSSTQLSATIPAESRPTSPSTDVRITVVNPEPAPATSAPFPIHFE